MSQKRREADSGKAIGETTALRWEPTHVTKPNPRVVPLQGLPVWGLDLRLYNIFCCLSNSAYKLFESIISPSQKQVSDLLWYFSYPYSTLTLTLVGTLRVYPTYLWWAKAQKWDQQCQGCPYYLRKPYPIQFRSNSSSSHVYIVCWPFTTTSSDIAGQKSLLQWL